MAGSLTPGTTHSRLIEVVATRSCITLSTGAGSVGTDTGGRGVSGPRGIEPNQRSTFALAVGTSMSPASTSTALFGP